ncbi:hypothetical protein SAMN05444170_4596 [Bradyrhizobium erythrophlei]|jgi:hypothetical protein|uniref:Uncharacterized protein n=1 Tax=Bradyrhizobium erythrophlei TaxID=1437360 RepID=A0A1M7UDG6_9BRAD|nr:hypothetical protein SAMN05444170_4596 [Bradyrhizobium erythrophlei]
MSKTLNSAIAVIGIDIGKNSFHVVGHDEHGAIVLRQKWSRGRCQPADSGLPPFELDDAHIAEATSRAAVKIVLERTALKKDDRLADFLTDAYATVGIAYHRAAGAYTMDQEMQELGTAAVHLLTIATSYIDAQKQEGTVR